MYKKKRILSIILAITIIFAFIGCIKNKEESKENITITINDEKISIEEVMIYVLQIKTEFEQLGGEDVWEIEEFSGGKTASEVAKQGALENLIKIKLLNQNAQFMNISLSGEEEKEARKKALEYYSNIDEKYIKNYNISKGIVESIFIENQIASKVTENIMNRYNPSEEEINKKLLNNEDYIKLYDKDVEDILTQVTVKHVFTKTHIESGKGEYVALSKDSQEKAYGKIKEARKRALNGESFDLLIELYSEDENKDETKGVYTFSEALMTLMYKEALKNINIGGISEIVKSQQGYHLFKVISRSNPTQAEVKEYKENFTNWTEALKNEYVNELKREAFNETYEDLKTNASIIINNDIWNSISIKNN